MSYYESVRESEMRFKDVIKRGRKRELLCELYSFIKYWTQRKLGEQDVKWDVDKLQVDHDIFMAIINGIEKRDKGFISRYKCESGTRLYRFLCPYSEQNGDFIFEFKRHCLISSWTTNETFKGFNRIYKKPKYCHFDEDEYCNAEHPDTHKYLFLEVEVGDNDIAFDVLKFLSDFDLVDQYLEHEAEVIYCLPYKYKNVVQRKITYDEYLELKEGGA